MSTGKEVMDVCVMCDEVMGSVAAVICTVGRVALKSGDIGQVLVERAAEVRAEDLLAAADAQQRHAARAHPHTRARSHRTDTRETRAACAPSIEFGNSPSVFALSCTMVPSQAPFEEHALPTVETRQPMVSAHAR